MSRLPDGIIRVPVPWGSAYGLARTLIALGTAGTLIFSDADTLFRPVRTLGEAPFCDGISGSGVFCLFPHDRLDMVGWACVAILLVVASGWRPRLTGIPHWYVSFSVMNNIAIPDGGDQIAAILTLLLVPVTLGDGRRWHWTPEVPRPSRGTRWASIGTAAAVCGLFAARLQVAGIYLNSSLAKLAVPEWVDGTSLYYWTHSPTFGAPPLGQSPAYWMVGVPLFVAALTWIPLILEFVLAISIVLSYKVKRILLPIGILFHSSIGLLMGLWSFVFVMFGALILLLSPIGHDASIVEQATARLRARWSRVAKSDVPQAGVEDSVPVNTPTVRERNI